MAIGLDINRTKNWKEIHNNKLRLKHIYKQIEE